MIEGGGRGGGGVLFTNQDSTLQGKHCTGSLACVWTHLAGGRPARCCLVALSPISEAQGLPPKSNMVIESWIHG